jgi:hypothetical protein
LKVQTNEARCQVSKRVLRLWWEHWSFGARHGRNKSASGLEKVSNYPGAKDGRDTASRARVKKERKTKESRASCPWHRVVVSNSIFGFTLSRNTYRLFTIPLFVYIYSRFPSLSLASSDRTRIIINKRKVQSLSVCVAKRAKDARGRTSARRERRSVYDTVNDTVDRRQCTVSGRADK